MERSGSLIDSNVKVQERFLNYVGSLWEAMGDGQDREQRWEDCSPFEHMSFAQAERTLRGTGNLPMGPSSDELAALAGSEESIKWVENAIDCDPVFRNAFLYATEGKPSHLRSRLL